MKYFSTFTGIGGFELGIEQAYENNRKLLQKKTTKGVRKNKSDHPSRQNGPTCVGYSENDKYAEQIYKKHYPNHKNYGDITKIKAEELPDFELLVGGFPCQSFSIAGKRGGFNDIRGTLFFDLARILRTKKPRLFLFENVKGLLSHDGGRTFKTIIATIDGLGYDCQWSVLNSKDFGVPQNRERVFIVGHTRGTARPEVFPLEADIGSDIVLPTLTARYYEAQANGGYIGNKQTKVGTLRTHKDGKGFREVKSGLSPTIPARAREDGSGQPVIIQKPRGKNNGGMHTIAPTMTGKSYQDNNHVGGVRRLTPMECERLQGFPDLWTQWGRSDCNCNAEVCSSDIEISDTQRYKTLGNGVTVNVVKAIMEKLGKTHLGTI